MTNEKKSDLEQVMFDYLDQELVDAALASLSMIGSSAAEDSAEPAGDDSEQQEKPSRPSQRQKNSTATARETIRENQTDQSPIVESQVVGKSRPAGKPQKAPEKFRQEILYIASDVLKIPLDEMDVRQNMAKYGVDSIIVTEIVKRISDVLDLPIAPTVFFEARHLNELVDILFSRYPKAVVARYESEVSLAGAQQTNADDILRSDDQSSDSDFNNSRIDNPEGQGFGQESAHPSSARALSLDEMDEPGIDDDVSEWIRDFIKDVSSEDLSQSIGSDGFQESVTPSPDKTVYQPVAIIAMDGQFPNSANLDEFEQHLLTGSDCISEIPPDRWDWESVYGDPEEGEFTKVKYGGFTPGIDKFDPLFFGMSPREAELMDPQHRLFMQCVWRLIESSGHAPGSLSGKKVGMFIGINLQDYAHLIDRYGAIEALHLTSLGHMFCPNRLSFMLDVHGPSQVIDTACSSSLVALHRAVLSIQHEDCEMAIAGGSNLLITPDMHVMYSKVGMICEDGRCKTFSKDANGYARCDGVGAVLLKSLGRAKEDGDTILGVIRGSSENHGGLSTSLTAPNPKAQAELIVEACRRGNIDPRTISHIECHGTGTPLGDPIEINGLKMAFERMYREAGLPMPIQPHCALGSVKSNIGHAETAAGIAGIIKSLLSLKRKRLYATLHCKEVNPMIDLENSPFYLLQEGEKWQPPVVDGQIVPRRVGVSSFGAGGSNAHVIVEEYLPEPDTREVGKTPSLVVLSGKNESSLEQVANNLKVYLQTCRNELDIRPPELIDVAYTLQVGRDGMPFRFATTVSSLDELIDNLDRFVKKQQTSDSENATTWWGNTRANRKALTVLLDDPETEPKLNQCLATGNLAELAELWIQGIDPDWIQLYQGAFWQDRYQNLLPRRVALPTYPFVEKRCWLPMRDPGEVTDRRGTGNGKNQSPIHWMLHPLVHQNTASLETLGFTSRFTGQEFFLADHVVNRRRIMPGVGYLEMGCESLQQLMVRDKNEQTELRNIVWASPFSISGESNVLSILVEKHGDRSIRYQIVSQSPDGSDVLHSQGHGELKTAERPSEMGLEKIKQWFEKNSECRGVISAEECYTSFDRLSINYGPAHRGIESILYGVDRNGDLGQEQTPQVLAKLSLPDVVSDTLQDYTLHPSMLDSALQSCIGLMFASKTSTDNPSLPFAIDSLKIYQPCCNQMWAWIRYAKGNSVNSRVQRIDIDLYDSLGDTCVTIRGFSSRKIDLKESTDSLSKDTTVMLYRPVLRSIPLTTRVTKTSPGYLPVDQQKKTVRTVFIIDFAVDGGLSSHGNVIKEELSPVDLVFIQAKPETGESGPAAIFRAASIRLFEHLKVLLNNTSKERLSVQVVIYGKGSSVVLRGLRGLLKTVEQEYRRFRGQIIWFDEKPQLPFLRGALADNYLAMEDHEVRYQGSARFVPQWEEVVDPMEPGSQNEEETGVNKPDQRESIPWKEKGVYLITGGAGGLGMMFCQEIVSRVQCPVVILVGRSPLSGQKQQQIEALIKNSEGFGPRVVYEQADVAIASQVDELVARMNQKYGPINGVLHTAGTLQDNFIRNKSIEDFEQVFKPKLSGTVNLDQATCSESLDFFVLFASGSGVFGSATQADYACANAFLDGYAHYRQSLVDEGAAYGRTVCIDWPLWESGGMAMDTETQMIMTQRTGVMPLPTDQGISAFYRSFHINSPQMLVMFGDPARIRQNLMYSPSLKKSNNLLEEPTAVNEFIADSSPSDPSGGTRLVSLQDALIRFIAEIMKFDVEELDVETELGEYGFDSITFTDFTNRLNKQYGTELTPTIFFEYPTVAEFSEYLLDNHSVLLAMPTDIQNQQSVTGGHLQIAPAAIEMDTEMVVEEKCSCDAQQMEVGHPTEWLQQLLIIDVANLMKFELHEMDVETELGEYGFDSITFTEFANRLNREYGTEITPTVFFEFPNITELVEHLLEEYPDQFMPLFESTRKQQPIVGIADSHESENDDSDGEGLTGAETPGDEAIAIVGMSGRFPMARDLDEFWDNLEKGKDCITEIPSDRWDWREIWGDPKKEANKTNIKWGGFIDEVGDFDAQFFGISPREAQLMDPQQRLLMEYVWKAIEDAGYSAKSLSGSNTAVLMGTASSGYGEMMASSNVNIESYSSTGVVGSVGPNRVSYYLNLHGPSEPIETACSSSLVAIHRAITAIRAGDCEQALVGGSNLIINPQTHISFNKAGMLSEDGRCKTFSSAANGYVRGEGIGVLFLKKLKAAERDGDHIHAVIIGSAENHGGRANSLTAPNPKAQAALLKKAYQRAGIDPTTVGYIEAHGTGTELGDPIEIEALKNAFSALVDNPTSGDSPPYCGLGSVKTNIGHLELSAGVAGVIKTILQIRHKTLVQTLHCQSVNPYIKIENTPFYIVDRNREWKALSDGNGLALPRRAGVSSFGFGGVNAHVILEEYLPHPRDLSQAESEPKLASGYPIILSARDADSLMERARQLLDFLKSKPERLPPGENDETRKMDGMIVELVSEAIGVDATEIGRHENFEDMGVDMVQRTQIMESIKKAFDIEMNAKAFLRCEAISSISRMLVDNYSHLSSFEGPSHIHTGVIDGDNVDLDLATEVNPHINFLDLAYTLQVGREQMEQRLGFVAFDTVDLARKLQQVISLMHSTEVDEDGVLVRANSGIYSGYVTQRKRGAADSSMGTIDEEIRLAKLNGDVSKLLAFWVKGKFEKWKELYHSDGLFQSKRQRLSLPTYPFARTRHWVEMSLDSSTTLLSDNHRNRAIHPLLHQNVSTFDTQLFSSYFTGEEFFLKDHQINGEKILPAVAQLEMARAAAQESFGVVDQSQKIQLENMGWFQPIIAPDDGIHIQVSLYLRDVNRQHEIDYEIFTGKSSDRVVYSRGRCVFLQSEAPQQNSAIDLDRIRKEIIATGQVISVEQCYARFDESGLRYGPCHQGLREVLASQTQVLAKVSIPAEAMNSMDTFVLHPALMDSAIQSAIALSFCDTDDSTVLIPFALDRLLLLASPSQTMWVWLRFAENSHKDDRVPKLDIDLVDQKGDIFLSLSGLASRRIDSTTVHDEPLPQSASVESIRENASGGAASKSPDSLTRKEIEKKANDYFRQLLATALKLSPGALKADEAMEKYGIDSMMVIELTDKLETVFGTLSKTLFFEYQTIRELANYFLQQHREKMDRLLKLDRPSPARFASRTDIKPIQQSEIDDVTRARRTKRASSIEHRPVSGALNIAIVGLSGRYPESIDLGSFWSNLESGKDCISEVPEDRWSWREFYTSDRTSHGGHFSKWGGFMPDVDKFDPLFFNISPREAESMDPQERLFLQTSWGALEDAGYTPQWLQQGNGMTEIDNDLSGQVGVYVGVMYGEYQLVGMDAGSYEGGVVASSSYASIANRVSYLLNLHGPSMTLDTMCSSSMTAIHLASQDLALGRTNMALAGGVNVTIHPNKYTMLSAGQFISSNGHCESFGVGGDGYIPGEGVGAVVLKRLADAQRDGDHIYGVIKGSAINHGGKTNGYSVPNPRAQRAVIADALNQSGVGPEEISYIEAHGTGTKLGDPIEITGLTQAFTKHTSKKQFCWIGSAKSNIGHCESAAGIAGLTKVLLQMKKGAIVPSLHSENLNPNIDFEQTPFIVNQELRPWERPVIDGVVRERVAGISSFGAGGSNAHMIVGEYDNGLSDSHPGSNDVHQSCAVLLSAKTPSQLQSMVTRFSRFLQENAGEVKLADIAYTLQVGRQPMPYRLAMLVENLDELRETVLLLDDLDDLETSVSQVQNTFYGTAVRIDESLVALSEEEDMIHMMRQWMSLEKWDKLLGLWVKGVEIDWLDYYSSRKEQYGRERDDGQPVRISLPTYPFARERYWIEKEKGGRARSTGTGSGWIHPLLHENISDLTAQRYRSGFGGEESFLKDHVINGQKLFPGVAQFEMARAAANHAGATLLSRDSASFIPYVFRNHVWIKAIGIDNHEPLALLTDIRLQDNGIHYAIRKVGSTTKGESMGEDVNEAMVCGEGSIFLDETMGPRSSLDLSFLRQSFGNTHLSKEDCYGLFSKMGFEYGPSHQCIERIYYAGQQHSKPGSQGLVKLSISGNSTRDESGSEIEEMMLHPGIMDGALQGIIALGLGDQGNNQAEVKPLLPFAIDEIFVYEPCQAQMWAWVRWGFDDTGSTDNDIRKVDIDITNEDGLVCIEIRGFSCRFLNHVSKPTGSLDTNSHFSVTASQQTSGKAENQSPHGLLTLIPHWEPFSFKELERIPTYHSHTVVLLGASLDGDGPTCQLLESSAKSIGGQYADFSLSVFRLVKEMLGHNENGKCLLQIVVSKDGEERSPLEFKSEWIKGLSGILKTAQLESPDFTGQLIELDNGQNTISSTALAELSCYRDCQHFVYRDGGVQTRRWKEVADVVEPVVMPWKEKGTYLITGGVGGLGLVMAREITKQLKEVNLILTGRSRVDGDDQNSKIVQELDSLRRTGLNVVYYSMDVSNYQNVENVLGDIAQTHGTVDGVIHCAGLLRDRLIVNKTDRDWEQVLPPKVEGLVNLHRASRALHPDFFLLFSSTAGAVGNPGQSDYAAANGFMDAYARSMDGESGTRMLSINWPLWEQGGMDIDNNAKEVLYRNVGMVPLEHDAAMMTIYRGLQSKHSQIMVLQGDVHKLSMSMAGQLVVDEKAKTQQIKQKQRDELSLQNHSIQKKEEHESSLKIADSDDDLLAMVLGDVTKVIFDVLKVPIHRIDESLPVETYGVDSVIATQLVNELEREYPSLPKTLFFEYPSVKRVSEFLVERYRNKLREKLSGGSAEVRDYSEVSNFPQQGRKTHVNRITPRLQSSANLGQAHDVRSAEAHSQRDIAIIGLSGKYPKAENLAEFWENLKSGTDCIVEVPRERWDYRPYFSEDKNSIGTTYCKWGGFLTDVDQFDSLFFRISPSEAELMDPQERLFLEATWDLLEGAGYLGEISGSRCGSDVGVFVGSMYQPYHAFDSDFVREAAVSLSSHSSIANRVSYFFDFKGPSVAMDTMCSSSMVAVHTACESLINGECKVAIAGGVNLSLHPKKYVGLSLGQLVGSNANSTSFAEGDGYLPSEGVGAVLLKPLNEAIKDRDNIMAVIKSSALNHNGQSNGYAVPNPEAQYELIANHFRRSGIDPRTVSYVESAANGSAMGDAMEIRALSRAFKQFTQDLGFCSIGAVKSNIGHGEAVSGMSQLSKVILQLQHRQITPTIKVDALNPEIEFEDTAFVLQKSLIDWPQPVIQDGKNGAMKSHPRRAAISSFGAGGSNAHLIVEEYIAKEADAPQAQLQTQLQAQPFSSETIPLDQLILLSARNNKELAEICHRLSDYLLSNPGADLSRIAYTLQMGRTFMDSRLALIVNGSETLVQALSKLASPKALKALGIRGIAQEFPCKAYLGNLLDDYSEVKALFAGKSGDAMLSLLIEQGELNEIGYYWTRGIKIPFTTMRQEVPHSVINLPTYPFSKSRHWLPEAAEPETGAHGKSGGGELVDTHPPLKLSQPTFRNIERFLLTALSGIVGVAEEEIESHRHFQDYGLDSIRGQRMMRELEASFGISVSARDLIESPTIQKLATSLSDQVQLEEVSSHSLDINRLEEPRHSELMTFPLSQGQKGLWLLQKLYPSMHAYNVPIALRFRHGFNKAAFLQACQWVLNRYPILGASIKEAQGEPYQSIPGSPELYYEELDFVTESEEEIQRILKKKSKTVFDLDNGPLVRVFLANHGYGKEEKTGEVATVSVLITIHHIVFDGASSVIFMEALMTAYHQYCEGQGGGLSLSSESEASYADFVEWETSLLNSEKGVQHLAYWKRQLAGSLPVLTLPTDYHRINTQASNGNTFRVSLDASLSLKIGQFARENYATPSVLFLAVLKILIYRYTGEEDIVIGMPTMGRPERQFEGLPGYFINMILVRSRLSNDHNFSSFLKSLQLTVADGLDHSAYPFPVLVDALRAEQTYLSSPVFQISYAYQNFIPSGQLGDSEIFSSIEFIEGLEQEGADEFALEVYESEGGFTLKVDYDANLFSPQTIERMMYHYVNILQSAINDSDLLLGEIALLGQEEEHLLIDHWSHCHLDTGMDVLEETGFVHTLFSQQAVLTPQKVALRFGEETMSYAKLDNDSSALAHALVHERGLQPGEPVCVFMERSCQWVVSILAVFKSGGIYVPLDPEYPESRIRYLIEDSEAKLLLTTEVLRPRALGLLDDDERRVCIPGKYRVPSGNGEDQDTVRSDVEPGGTVINSEQPAYLIYTSGSTGRPKGVLVPHRSIYHQCMAMREAYELCDTDRVLQFSSANVDPSLEQVLPGLTVGATIILRDRNIWTPQEFFERVGYYGITIADIPPSYLHEILLHSTPKGENSPSTLRLIISGGEALTRDTVDLWKQSSMENGRLVNAYGPTETTITSSFFAIESDTRFLGQSIPIGKPVAGEAMYILDCFGRAVPQGISGELYVGGRGVSLGYLNNQNLTDQNFVNNPFIRNSRMYRTGDIARWLGDGNIEFLGRRDSQVKVRGHRIEIGEVEAAIRHHLGMRDVVVIDKMIGGTLHLVAYVVPVSPGATIQGSQLKSALKSHLPQQMIPSFFIEIDEIPMTAGDKVDRQRLAERQDEFEQAVEFVLPETPVQSELIDIWQRVLTRDRVGVHDNFFEIGGHSLLAVRLMSTIFNEMGVDLPISTLFEAPTVFQQAKYFDSQYEQRISPLVPIHTKGDLDPMFFLHAAGGDVMSYQDLIARMGEDRPLYGLQSVRDCDEKTSLEKVAGIYLDSIMETHKGEVLNLAGWSMGGVLAFEVAQQYRRISDNKINLFLIESHTPSAVKEYERKIIESNGGSDNDREWLLLIGFARNLGVHDADKIQIIIGDKVLEPHYDRVLNRIARLLGDDFELQELKRLYRVFKSNAALMDDYNPVPYSGEITLFKVSQDPLLEVDNGGWSILTAGKLEVIDVPGDHYSVIGNENANFLAEQINRKL